MSLIPLATEFSYRRGTPKQSCANLYAEATPQGPRDFSLRPRDCLFPQYTVGTGPIYLVVEVTPTLTYVLSGDQVFVNGATIGFVGTGGPKQAAFSDEQLVIVSGAAAYLIDYRTHPTTMTPIADPDLPGVSGVTFSNGRFIYPELGSGTYYYSEINDAGNIDGLSFANAEASPDPIVRVEILGDQVVFFGTDSLEFHSPTSDPSAPFQRAPGQTQDKGCIAPASVVKCDNGLFWIGQDQRSGRMVFRSNGGVPQRVSTHSIEAALQDATAANVAIATAFTYIGAGHTFYVINVPEIGSFALDLATNKWAEWSSYDQDTFRICAGSGVFYGDHEGNVFIFTPEVLTDDGDPVVWVTSCFIPVESRGRCNVIVLEGATGGSKQMGPGSDAVVEMRYTDELTGDFTDWDSSSIGLHGDYGRRVDWWQLGLLTAPGRLFEFRGSDPALFVPVGVMMNVRP